MRPKWTRYFAMGIDMLENVQPDRLHGFIKRLAVDGNMLDGGQDLLLSTHGSSSQR